MAMRRSGAGLPPGARKIPRMPEMWDHLQERIIRCERCPRLIEHCRSVARVKRAAFRDEAYWGRPVPNFGDPAGRLLIVGLAPAAHGANRTGRMFTGDRSGDFLYRALHETGFANQPTARDAGDGLALTDIAITAAAHCAPPGNKPTRQELAHCFGHLRDTVDAMPNLRGVIALGGIAFNACIELYRELGWATLKPKPKFAHAAVHEFDAAPDLIGCYHPSQQNTFTGRLTMDMLQQVFRDARARTI